MYLTQAQTLAHQYMNQYGLLEKGWRFAFNRRKSSHGLCSYTKKTIFLSESYVQLNEAGNITNTILHEIAHALVGPWHNHDNTWRMMAKSIGCTGERCGSADVVQAPGKYKATCKSCSKEHQVHRLPKHALGCSPCVKQAKRQYGSKSQALFNWFAEHQLRFA